MFKILIAKHTLFAVCCLLLAVCIAHVWLSTLKYLIQLFPIMSALPPINYQCVSCPYTTAAPESQGTAPLSVSRTLTPQRFS
jgi:hypothetical protein